MAKDWTPARARHAPRTRPTSITAVARTYHAAALALGQSLGLSLQEVLTHHRESATAVFIECCKQNMVLPAGVQLPPLAGEAPVASMNGQTGETLAEGMPQGFDGQAVAPVSPPVGQPVHGDAPLPTVIPPELPCAGQAIVDLKPAALAMVLGKVAALAHADGDRWAVLLYALQRERQTRVAQGRRPQPPPVEGDGGAPSGGERHGDP